MRCYMMSETNDYIIHFNNILCQMADKMLSAKKNNNITPYFIECMVPHHQAAINMCENLLCFTHYPALEQVAHGIIQMQTKGIEQMIEIAKTTPDCFNQKRDVFCYTDDYLRITNRMICRMRNSLKSNNINLNFVSEMIPHHEGAIAMCHNLLQYCIDPRLRKVADTIIQEQSEGVRQLQQIRTNLCE